MKLGKLHFLYLCLLVPTFTCSDNTITGGGPIGGNKGNNKAENLEESDKTTADEIETNDSAAVDQDQDQNEIKTDPKDRPEPEEPTIDVYVGTQNGNPPSTALAAMDTTHLEISENHKYSSGEIPINKLELETTAAFSDVKDHVWAGTYIYDIASESLTPKLPFIGITSASYGEIDIVFTPKEKEFKFTTQYEYREKVYTLSFEIDEYFELEFLFHNKPLVIDSIRYYDLLILFDAKKWHDDIDYESLLGPELNITISSSQNRIFYDKLRDNISKSFSVGIDFNANGKLDAEETQESTRIDTTP